jgi:hypothetical protein
VRRLEKHKCRAWAHAKGGHFAGAIRKAIESRPPRDIVAVGQAKDHHKPTIALPAGPALVTPRVHNSAVRIVQSRFVTFVVPRVGSGPLEVCRRAAPGVRPAMNTDVAARC